MRHFPDSIARLPDYAGRFDAKRLAAEGCEILFASYPAGTEIEFHSHDTDNVGVITEGELILMTGTGERRYGPGDWYHIPAHEKHAARFERETSEIEFWFEPDNRDDE